jgi:hypothetical protein
MSAFRNFHDAIPANIDYTSDTSSASENGLDNTCTANVSSCTVRPIGSDRSSIRARRAKCSSG